MRSFANCLLIELTSIYLPLKYPSPLIYPLKNAATADFFAESITRGTPFFSAPPGSPSTCFMNALSGKDEMIISRPFERGFLYTETLANSFLQSFTIYFASVVDVLIFTPYCI